MDAAPATAEDLPKVCTQKTVKVRPPAQALKLYQRNYWGSEAWAKVYNLRTYVEGVFGNLKNSSCENLRRGCTRGRGLGWTNLVAALAAASYNERSLLRWHELSGQESDHPLLRRYRTPIGYEPISDNGDEDAS